MCAATTITQRFIGRHVLTIPHTHTYINKKRSLFFLSLSAALFKRCSSLTHKHFLFLMLTGNPTRNILSFPHSSYEKFFFFFPYDTLQLRVTRMFPVANMPASVSSCEGRKKRERHLVPTTSFDDDNVGWSLCCFVRTRTDGRLTFLACFLLLLSPLVSILSILVCWLKQGHIRRIFYIEKRDLFIMILR